MYAPIVQSARTVKRYQCGPYEAAFLDQVIAAEGSVEYEFIIVVFEKGATDPFLFVTSEKNDPMAAAKLFQELGLEPDMMPIDRGASHFLCIFDKNGHHNLGDSNDWGESEKFEMAALKILTERLGEMPIIV